MKPKSSRLTSSEAPRFSAATNIAEALTHGPHIAEVFLRYRMYCIGCTFARFESLKAAAVNHSIDVEEFVNALNAVSTEARHESQPSGSTMGQS
jgi:hybrid cluster-associated redox disulfide protein